MAHPRELLQQLFERRDLSQAQAEEQLTRERHGLAHRRCT